MMKRFMRRNREKTESLQPIGGGKHGVLYRHRNVVLKIVGMTFVTSLVCLAAEAVIEHPAGAYIVTLVDGIYGSSTQTLFFPLTISILGLAHCETGFGLVLATLGCGCMLGPPLVAWTFDKFGYSVLFRFSGALYLVSGLLVSLTYHGHEEESANTAGGDKLLAGNPVEVAFGSQCFEIVVPAKETEDALGTDEGEAFLVENKEESNICASEGHVETKNNLHLEPTNGATHI
ncbi:hypothetical protein EGW08_009042 [Elysia chlorotica]|uniref:Major facilitator superfamily (MFS) profile domain-containing protein n=1 Tax=Elysia chlorotica TaxID=188477 RepID=A0A433TNN4_ELYCH|nr:hypothetical protein EGW08_009042 [Elysia chlorotica]